MKVSIAIACACLLFIFSCAGQNKMLKYYKMELEDKNKTVKEWDDATFQHVDGFDLITERSKVLAQKKIKMVTEFMKENSKLFYDYSVVVDQKNMDVDWKKPGNERARFEEEEEEPPPDPPKPPPDEDEPEKNPYERLFEDKLWDID